MQFYFFLEGEDFASDDGDCVEVSGARIGRRGWSGLRRYSNRDPVMFLRRVWNGGTRSSSRCRRRRRSPLSWCDVRSVRKTWIHSCTAVMRRLQLRLDFDSTAVRLLIKGHESYGDVTRQLQ